MEFQAQAESSGPGSLAQVAESFQRGAGQQHHSSAEVADIGKKYISESFSADSNALWISKVSKLTGGEGPAGDAPVPGLVNPFEARRCHFYRSENEVCSQKRPYLNREHAGKL